MNTTELKALAEKATPGPWITEDWASTDNDGAINVCGTSVTAPQALCGIFTVALEGDDLSDVEYIAAANPAAILELIAAHEDAQGEIRELRERVKALEDGVRNLVKVKGRYHTEQAYKALAALLEQKP